MRNALSIDVEDYFQVHALEHCVARPTWERQPRRVVANTQRVLRILAEHHTQATFFVLGWVAERCPELVRQIAAAGHEIASHGYSHELIYRQTPAEFAADVEAGLRALRCALQTPVLTPLHALDDRPAPLEPLLTGAGHPWLGSEIRERPLLNYALSTGNRPADGTPAPAIGGYRAPSFSIVERTRWALNVLREQGFRYDSSIFPLALHDRYGIPNARRFAHRLDSGLWELPVSTVRVLGRNWPVAGGGYFRLYPYAVTAAGIRRIQAEGRPAVIYLHPWELDPSQPRLAGAGALARFRHYVNLDKTEKRLHRLLQEFEFAPMTEVFGV